MVAVRSGKVLTTFFPKEKHYGESDVHTFDYDGRRIFILHKPDKGDLELHVW